MVRRLAAVVAGVLGADGLMHVYWATGATWPAHDSDALSQAVLGTDVPFTAVVLIPLATLLFTAAATVLLRTRAAPDRRLWWAVRAGTVAVAGGLLLRALAGVVWVFGVGTDTGSLFYWLNLLAYTPLCLGLGAAAVAVARSRDGIRDGILAR